jgi:ribonuclease BN (tRNA processing enzyme)
MELTVVGCHGGETPKHRTCGFVVAASTARRAPTLAFDAGSLASGLTIEAQCALGAVLVSHAHLDHVKELATLIDNRCQAGAPPLVVAGNATAIAALKKHFFNGVMWPDFTKIPTSRKPTFVYQVLRAERPVEIGGFEINAIPVTHTVDCSGFVVRVAGQGGAVAYSGDTGPTDRLWEVLDETEDLRAALVEVSFPDEEQRLSTTSGHHTPKTLARDLEKLKVHRHLPILAYHMKPVFQPSIERQLARLRTGHELEVLGLGDRIGL